MLDSKGNKDICLAYELGGLMIKLRPRNWEINDLERYSQLKTIIPKLKQIKYQCEQHKTCHNCPIYSSPLDNYICYAEKIGYDLLFAVYQNNIDIPMRKQSDDQLT